MIEKLNIQPSPVRQSADLNDSVVEAVLTRSSILLTYNYRLANHNWLPRLVNVKVG